MTERDDRRVLHLEHMAGWEHACAGQSPEYRTPRSPSWHAYNRGHALGVKARENRWRDSATAFDIEGEEDQPPTRRGLIRR